MPVMILLIIEFLAKSLSDVRMSRCAERAKDFGEVFRLDAKAEGEEVKIGGWRSLGKDKKTGDAPWFAVKLNRRNAMRLGLFPGWSRFARSPP